MKYLVVVGTLNSDISNERWWARFKVILPVVGALNSDVSSGGGHT